MMIRRRAYARGALIGNPSDGYFGKTIALTFRNFSAEVALFESAHLEILRNVRDHSRFRDIHALVEDVSLYGYYGGIRLLEAAVKRFYEHCRESGQSLEGPNFTLRYHSNIPHLVGLAGSSAIVTACMRALMAFYGVTIPKPVLAGLVLSAETDELGISAGLQDRVAQVYGGLVYMDFARELMAEHGHGCYEPLDAARLPPLYVAYRRTLSQESDVAHKALRYRFEKGDPQVLDAIRYWAELTDSFRSALLGGDTARLPGLINANLDRRVATYDISEGNRQMIDAARGVGASAKFTGSGGAIIGTVEDENMYQALQLALGELNVEVIRPEIAEPTVEE